MSLALIAMSGGVDSSVSAYLAVQVGYEAIGATLKLFDSNQQDACYGKTCCSEQDVLDAKSVCHKLGIPHYILNYKEEFKKEVIDKFVDTYKNGGTPSPCIDCNRYIKFQKMLDFAKKMNCDRIVTGHYAIIEQKDNKYYLKKAKDASKDQTYFLYFLNQEILPYLEFPLGYTDKSITRKIAEEQGFRNSNKPDSQDICFIPDGNLSEFLARYTCFTCGNFVDKDGNILGKHEGVEIYTIGQRKGLGISSANPLYVNKKDKADIILGSNEDLFAKKLTAKNLNIICDDIPDDSKITAKIRSTGKDNECVFNRIDEDKFSLEFTESQRAIAKGQAVVLYDGEYCLGGGEIC